MIRFLRRRPQTTRDPLQERWRYFADRTDAIHAAVSLIQAVPDEKLRDISFLEHELIPSIGLNDENLDEQPNELAQYYGTGIHVFQYPNQLARYLAWMVDHASQTHSYVELGSRWGGTFILTCEWLLRIGAPLTFAIAVDPIGETPMLAQYGSLLTQRSVQYRFIKNLSSSQAVQSLFDDISPDYVFVDGDHSLKAALADHMLARKSAAIIVHHDISSDACPDTTVLWSALRELESEIFTAYEFTEQYSSVSGSYLGIGVMMRRAFLDALAPASQVAASS